MKNDNVKLVSLIIVVLGIYLGIKFFEVYNKELNSERVKVIKENISVKAKRCYEKEDCTGEVTIKDLRNKRYISGELINPMNKETINENIKIRFISDTVFIDWDF